MRTIIATLVLPLVAGAEPLPVPKQGSWPSSYREMAKIIEAYAPWRLNIARYRNMLVQPQVQGFKKHPILHNEWAYIDVAAKTK